MSHEGFAYEALIQFLYQAPIGLLRTDIDGEIMMINPMAASLLMPLARDGDLSNLFDVLAPFVPDLRARAAAHAGLGDPVGGRTLPIRPGGIARSGSAQTTIGLHLVRLDASTWMATIVDITQAQQEEQQRLKAKLRDQSRTDSLTGLPNGTVAAECIEAALAAARTTGGERLAVLFVNLDRFSRINTSRGSAAGDLMLRLTADRLAQLVEPGGALEAAGAGGLSAARLGADEFVVVAQRLRAGANAADLAAKLVEAMRQPYRVDHRWEHASASVGLVLGPEDGAASGADADSLLQDGSIAMRDAKRAGGARYSLFEPAMKARAARRATIESDLRNAVERGELTVAYQPIVALTGRQCVGLEALVRWQHPTLGAVPPPEFIAIAEETDLIVALGRFVLVEACIASVALRRELGDRAPRSMSVNVSRAQLVDGGFAGHVRRALQTSGMGAEDLQLEVTESLAAQDETVRERLHDLKELGVSIALDDFGTGYSSLASLHQLPIDVLKIDRSFVTQLESSPHHSVLIEAVILVAKSLVMSTVAEGIETEGQAVELARLQCDKGQGYLFARPLPLDGLRNWLEVRAAERKLSCAHRDMVIHDANLGHLGHR